VTLMRALNTIIGTTPDRGWRHGLSVFFRIDDDVFHTWSTYARGTSRLRTPIPFWTLHRMGAADFEDSPRLASKADVRIVTGRRSQYCNLQAPFSESQHRDSLAETFRRIGTGRFVGCGSGRGRKPVYEIDKIAAIIEATLQTKPAGMTHWSCRTLAAQQGVNKSMVNTSGAPIIPFLVTWDLILTSAQTLLSEPTRLIRGSRRVQRLLVATVHWVRLKNGKAGRSFGHPAQTRLKAACPIDVLLGQCFFRSDLFRQTTEDIVG